MKKGTKHTKETKLKMRSKALGRIVSIETRNKIRTSRIGKTLSEESKKKVSESKKGKHTSPSTEFKQGHKLIGAGIKAIITRPNYINKGKLIQKGERKSIKTEIKKGQRLSPSTEFKKGITSWIKGKTHSEETRIKLREVRLHQIMPKRDTMPERRVQNWLTKKGILFETHKPILGQPDIFLEPNMCIFVDGCYWHGCPICFKEFNIHQIKNKKRDEIVTQRLREQGYIVLRIWEHNITEEGWKV